MRSKTCKVKGTLIEYCAYCCNEVYENNATWVFAYPEDPYPSPVHVECLKKRTV